MIITNAFLSNINLKFDMIFVSTSLFRKIKCSCVNIPAEVTAAARFSLVAIVLQCGSFAYQTLDGAAVWIGRSLTLPQNCINYLDTLL